MTNLNIQMQNNTDNLNIFWVEEGQSYYSKSCSYQILAKNLSDAKRIATRNKKYKGSTISIGVITVDNSINYLDRRFVICTKDAGSKWEQVAYTVRYDDEDYWDFKNNLNDLKELNASASTVYLRNCDYR